MDAAAPKVGPVLVIDPWAAFFFFLLCAAGVCGEPGSRDACSLALQPVHGGPLHPDQPADLVPERDQGGYLPESRGVGLHGPR